MFLDVSLCMRTLILKVFPESFVLVLIHSFLGPLSVRSCLSLVLAALYICSSTGSPIVVLHKVRISAPNSCAVTFHYSPKIMPDPFATMRSVFSFIFHTCTLLLLASWRQCAPTNLACSSLSDALASALLLLPEILSPQLFLSLSLSFAAFFFSLSHAAVCTNLLITSPPSVLALTSHRPPSSRFARTSLHLAISAQRVHLSSDTSDFQPDPCQLFFPHSLLETSAPTASVSRLCASTPAVIPLLISSRLVIARPSSLGLPLTLFSLFRDNLRNWATTVIESRSGICVSNWMESAHAPTSNSNTWFSDFNVYRWHDDAPRNGSQRKRRHMEKMFFFKKNLSVVMSC